MGKQLRQLALDNDTTVQALLEEALNDLFLKHGKSPIA
ncbi:MAG: ribbon-helix-helix domain-containing protein [Cuspidothrix sp.]